MRVKVLLITFLLGILSVAEAQIKIGIIGLDTSHAIAFTKFLNGVDKKEEFKDFKIALLKKVDCVMLRLWQPILTDQKQLNRVLTEYPVT